MKTIPLFCVVTVTFAVMCVPTIAQTRPALPFTLSKETTVITSPLNADGTPNYIAALNEKYGKGITPENNGFVLYLQAVGTGDNILPSKTRDRVLKLAGTAPMPPNAPVFELFEPWAGGPNLDDDAKMLLTDELTAARQHLWKQSNHGRVATYLKAQGQFLDTIAEAAAKPRWWEPLVSADGRTMVGVLFPSLGNMRGAANALAARATFRAGSGDFDGFIHDAIAIKRLSYRQASAPILLERLVGIFMDRVADEAIGAVVGTGLLTEKQCETLTFGLKALPTFPSIIESLNVTERWSLLDDLVLTAMGRAPPALLEILGGDELGVDWERSTTGLYAKLLQRIDLDSIDWNLVLLEANKMFDQLVAASSKATLQEQRQATTAFDHLREQWHVDFATQELSKGTDETPGHYSVRIGRGLASALTSSMGRADEVRRRVALEDEMLKLLLAAAQIHAKTGKWPAKLADLSPAYVKEIPRDLYPVDAPSELQYTVTPAGIRIWSIGDNNHPFGVGIQLPN